MGGVTHPCSACGRTFLSAPPTYDGQPGHATPPPRPGSRRRVCRADDVYPCRCSHPVHRGGCSRCDCQTYQPDTSVDHQPTGGRRRAAARTGRRSASPTQLTLREEIS
jgi:hypothetical protein